MASGVARYRVTWPPDSSATSVGPHGLTSSIPGSPWTTSARSWPKAAKARTTKSRNAGSGTPTTWRRVPAGLASGPSRFMIVVTPSAFRTGAAWRMAGCSRGANMNTTPARDRTSAMPAGDRSRRTPSASSTSALPDFEVKERLPCLATRTPPAAATSAAAVEMLKVGVRPPPAPHVSTSPAGFVAGTRIMASRKASTPPATSEGAGPLA